MFIYETRNIFSEDGDGPFRGLVIKATPADFFPAMEGETVVFLEETEEGISLEESFSVGEEAEEGKKPQKADTPEELVDNIANAEDGAVIKLTSDMAVEEAITVSGDKSITLDLGGKKLSSESGQVLNLNGGSVELKNGSVESSGRPVIVYDGELTLDGAEVTSTSDCGVCAAGESASVVMNSGKITAQESGVLITAGAKLEMNGGEIECVDNCPIQGNGSTGQGDVEIVMNGGKLVAHIKTRGYIACAVYMPNSGTFTMNGGEIESDGCGVCMRAGQVNLEGGSIICTGDTPAEGKVGDGKQKVGHYAVVYDQISKYPGASSGTFELNIASGMQLQGTDGDIQVLLEEGAEANIHDNRA